LDVGLEASKEIVDAVKYVGERILAGRNGLGRSESELPEQSKRWNQKDTHRKKNAYPGEDHSRGWIYLYVQ
jgi:hypothetical protein